MKAGDTVTVTGTVQSLSLRLAKNRPLKMVEARVTDKTGTLNVVWFNQPYLEKTLLVGTRVSLAGRVENKFGLSLINPIIERSARAGVHTGRIVPVYGLTGSLTTRRMREAMEAALCAVGECVYWLPDKPKPS